MIGTAVNVAQTSTLTDGQVTQVTGWEDKGSLWLILYTTNASDGLVYVTTRPGVDGATVGDVQDRRTLRPPAQFYLGPYQYLGIATNGGDESPTVNFEIQSSPVQPVRSSPYGAECKCER